MNTNVMLAVIAGAITGWTTSTGVKSQAVRLIDVWALGPLMVYAATIRNPEDFVRQALAFTGASTVTYNARNYMRLRDFPEVVKMFEAQVMGKPNG